MKGVSAARTRQGRRSRSSRPLTGSTAGINADTKGAGDEEKSRRRNEHGKDEAARKVAQREQASPLSPVTGQSSGRFGPDHGLKDSSNGFNVDLGLRQILHSSDRSGVGRELASGNEMSLVVCAGVAHETTRRDAGEGSGSTSVRASFRVGCRISRPEISAEAWAERRSVPATSAIAAGSAERSF